MESNESRVVAEQADEMNEPVNDLAQMPEVRRSLRWLGGN